MGVCIPEMNLSVLSAGNKLLHGGMDVQAPQLICVTLERILLNTPHTNMLLCVCVCVYVPAQSELRYQGTWL